MTPLPLPFGGDRRCRTVGLLGGSFNPAHAGHLYISLAALARLGLDEVWWLVSPQNPLKPPAGMAPLAERLAAARALARHPRIRVTDIECRFASVHTANTLRELRRRFPRVRFVWLMGADNLKQIPRWKHWREIFRRTAIAVFARSPYSWAALAGRAARRYVRCRVGPWRAHGMAARQPPAWTFLPIRPHPASATRIRAAAAAGVPSQATGASHKQAGQDTLRPTGHGGTHRDFP
ncbi:MAG: nicotinate-nucleotide adenylyltransferase [Alphaproteobacteria bacterium]